MEHALGESWRCFKKANLLTVLILIVMEHALGVLYIFEESQKNKS